MVDKQKGSNAYSVLPLCFKKEELLLSVGEKMECFNRLKKYVAVTRVKYATQNTFALLVVGVAVKGSVKRMLYDVQCKILVLKCCSEVKEV